MTQHHLKYTMFMAQSSKAEKAQMSCIDILASSLPVTVSRALHKSSVIKLLLCLQEMCLTTQANQATVK